MTSTDTPKIDTRRDYKSIFDVNPLDDEEIIRTTTEPEVKN